MLSDIYDSLQNTKETLSDKVIGLQSLTSELKYANIKTICC